VPQAHADDAGAAVCRLWALGESPLDIAAKLQNGRPDVSDYDARKAVFEVIAQQCGPTIEQ
jgi:hypothetical protein